MEKLPPELLAFFKEHGAKGERIGDKRCLETMTPEKRAARAKKASKAVAEARKAKARWRRGPQKRVASGNGPVP